MVSTVDRMRENREVLAEMKAIEQRTAAYADHAKRLLGRHLWIVLLVATLAGVAGALLAASAGLVENVLIQRRIDEQIEERKQTLRKLDERLEDRLQTLRELDP